VFITGSFATQTLLVHQVAYLVDHGVPALAAASVVGVVGLASVAGKTGWGALSDRYGREPAYTLAFACVLASVGVLVAAGAWRAPIGGPAACRHPAVTSQRSARDGAQVRRTRADTADKQGSERVDRPANGALHLGVDDVEVVIARDNHPHAVEIGAECTGKGG